MLKIASFVVILLLIIISLFILSYNTPTQNNTNTAQDYNEKIENFKLYKFNNQQITQQISAKEYINYHDKTIINGVSFTDNKYNISADSITQQDNNIIIASGDINIGSIDNNDTHTINTDKLIVDGNNKYIFADGETVYFDGEHTITTEGMRIEDNIIYLIGDNIIEHDDYTITTKNLLINNETNQYISNAKTKFISYDISVLTDSFNLANDTIHLKGNVTAIINHLNIKTNEMHIKY